MAARYARGMCPLNDNERRAVFDGCTSWVSRSRIMQGSNSFSPAAEAP